MMRRIKKIYFVLISVMLLFACGCANNHTTYTYDNPKEASGFTLNKAVYTKGKLKLYSPDFGGKFELTCYDNNFNVIEEEFETSYKDGVYTIKGKAAEKISGIVLQNYSTKYCIRYLDSNQYAAICYYEATEIGWTTSDDGENYYTEEERQKQKEAKESWQNRQKNNFELMLGEWTLLGDDKQAEAAVKQLKQAGANKLVSAKWDYVDDQYVINVLTEEQTVYGVFLTDSGDVDRVEELTTAP